MGEIEIQNGSNDSLSPERRTIGRNVPAMLGFGLSLIFPAMVFLAFSLHRLHCCEALGANLLAISSMSVFPAVFFCGLGFSKRPRTFAYLGVVVIVLDMLCFLLLIG